MQRSITPNEVSRWELVGRRVRRVVEQVGGSFIHTPLKPWAPGGKEREKRNLGLEGVSFTLASPKQDQMGHGPHPSVAVTQSRRGPPSTWSPERAWGQLDVSASLPPSADSLVMETWEKFPGLTGSQAGEQKVFVGTLMCCSALLTGPLPA